MQKKTREETIKAYKNYNKPIEFLYNEKFVNWSGKTKDSNEYYTEIIALELFESIKNFKNIGTITRTKSYKVNNHCNVRINNCDSNRDEENFAKRITELEIEELGKIIDYQIPLKSTNANEGLGKIDLISFHKNLSKLHLIELKYGGNKDTLLKSILEIFTYYKLVDTDKLKKDFLGGQDINLEKIKTIPTVLVSTDCNAYKELIEMYDGKRQYLKALSIIFGIEFYEISINCMRYEI